jgi:hypothetical protein
MRPPQTKNTLSVFLFACLTTAVVSSVLWVSEFALILPIKQAGRFAWLVCGVFAYHSILASVWQFAAKRNPWNSGRYFVISTILPIAWLLYGVLTTDKMDGLTFLLNTVLLVPMTFFVCLVPYPVTGAVYFLYRAATERKTP